MSSLGPRIWAPTIVGTMKVQHKPPTNDRTYGMVNGEVTDERMSLAGAEVRREIWFVFTEDAAGAVSFGSILGSHTLGKYWNRLPAGGGGPVPPNDGGSPESASRFEPIAAAHAMKNLDFVAAVLQALADKPFIIVDASVSVWIGWQNLSVYQATVAPGRVEECFDKATSTPLVRERAYLMARREVNPEAGDLAPSKMYTSLYIWRADGFPEDTFDSKAARPFPVVDIPHPGSFVMEQDWLEWAKGRLCTGSTPAPSDERAAVCDVKVYRDAERDAYVSYVLANQALP